MLLIDHTLSVDLVVFIECTQTYYMLNNNMGIWIKMKLSTSRHEMHFFKVKHWLKLLAKYSDSAFNVARLLSVSWQISLPQTLICVFLAKRGLFSWPWRKQCRNSMVGNGHNTDITLSSAELWLCACWWKRWRMRASFSLRSWWICADCSLTTWRMDQEKGN